MNATAYSMKIRGIFVGRDFRVQWTETTNDHNVSDEITVFTTAFDVVNPNSFMTKTYIGGENGWSTGAYPNIFERFFQSEDVFTPVHLFFAIICYEKSGDGYFTQKYDENWLKIATRHVARLGNEKIDSQEALGKALNPWWSQLGFENYEILEKCLPQYPPFKAFAGMDSFLDNPQMFKLFKRFVVAKYTPDEKIGPKGVLTKFSEIEEVFDFGSDLVGDPAYFLAYFANFPFHDEYIVNKAEEMTFAEFRSIGETPKGSSPEVMREIFDNDLEEFKLYKHVPKIREANNLYNRLFDSMNDSMIQDTEKLYGVYDHIMLSYQKAGFRSVMSEIADTGLSYFDSVDHFIDVSNLLTDNRKSMKWVKDCGDYDNFVTMKLQEKLGAFVAIEVIQAVFESDETLNYVQWLALADSYESVKDCPVSWWVSIL